MQQQTMPLCFAIADLQNLLHQSPEDVLVIDVRTPEEFLQQHLPVAINIPLVELKFHADRLPKNKQIITVCGKGGGRSEEAALLLQQAGFSKATYLCGGTFGWYASVNI